MLQDAATMDPSLSVCTTLASQSNSMPLSTLHSVQVFKDVRIRDRDVPVGDPV